MSSYEENKQKELEIKEELAKYEIDVGEYHQLRIPYEFQGNIVSSTKIELILGSSMGEYSISLCGGHSILVKPYGKKLAEITDVKSFVRGLVDHLFELDKRAKALTSNF